MGPLAQISDWLLTAGMALLAMMLLLRIAARSRKKASANSADARTTSRAKASSGDLLAAHRSPGVDRVADAAVLQIHDAARDYLAEIQTRQLALASLTRRAEEATERLERAIARAEAANVDVPSATRSGQ